MPKVSARQVWITVLLGVLAAPIYLTAGSAAFRPAWLGARVGGVPVTGWIMLVLIVIFLVMVRVISATVFAEQQDGEGDAK